jgi:nonribosomal peptide synthetase protein VioO
VVDAFFACARTNAHRPAIVGNGRQLRYGELARSVRELALRLGPDCGVVGVLVTRSEHTIVALLATLAAGGTYCPIDPTFPIERQRALLRASGARFVVATAGGQRSVGDLPVVEPPDPLSASPDFEDDPLATAEPDSPAYLLFTSGSTGEPKGVLTPRRALDVAVDSLRGLFAITPADRVLQFASLNWDTCFEEITPTLTTGASLVIDDEAYTGSLPRLLRLVAREQVTVLNLPTAFWHELVNYLGEECTAGTPALPASVRAVIIGGEAVRPARLAEWRSLDTSRIRLVNTYGATETTLITHALDLHGPLAESIDVAAAEPVPIGRALPHVTEHIGDDDELFIAGPSLALGYLGLADASAARFPVLDLGDGLRRYFRSGDRVSRGANGTLVYRGRLDNQLKVRGIRVDLGEVEAELARHPGVAAVAVTGVSIADHTTLAAYVVPRASADGSTLSAELFAQLRARVPAHLVPASITVVPTLVYTPSGKVDRAGTHRHHRPEPKFKETSR